MSSRGRNAAQPPDGHQRPSPIAFDGLMVTHLNEKGDASVDYDFSLLSVGVDLQRQLAAIMAERVKPTGPWRNLPTSKQVWDMLVTFSRFLSSLELPPNQIADIDLATWKQWRLSRWNSATGRRWLRLSSAYLLDHPDVRHAVREEMSVRLPRDVSIEATYTEAQVRAMKSTASRIFREAEHRIGANLEHLRRYGEGEFEPQSVDGMVGQALECLMSTGDVPIRLDQRGVRNVDWRFVKPLGGSSSPKTWERLFLTSVEAMALTILITLKHGWNLTSVNELTVPSVVPSESDGPIYRVEIEKRRRKPPHRYETRSIADYGSKSEGRLFTRAIAVTEPARAFLRTVGAPTDRLIAWHVYQGLTVEDRSALVRFGVGEKPKESWTRATGVEVNFRRIRKTVNVRYRRTPNQNTQDTHDSKYVLLDPQAQRESEPRIAEGILEAVQHAEKTVAATILHSDRVDGDETATASCRDELNSPFSETGVACRASFLLCLSCRNAVVMPKHLKRLSYLHECLRSLKGSVSPAVWREDWDEHFQRLENLRSQHYSSAEWERAIRQVTDEDRAIISSLLKGELDA